MAKHLKKMLEARKRINKKAGAPTPAELKNNIGALPMSNLQNANSNVNPVFTEIINSHIRATESKVVLKNTDLDYVEYLIQQNKLDEARNVLNNIKSTAKSLNERIMVTESYLQSFELE